jgi:predicted peroxiredoxin
MARVLVQVATGPENVTRAALGFLVARYATDAGHEVDLFVVGDAVGLLRPVTMEASHGIGTGHVREHVDALVAGGRARFYVSRLSARARGLGEPDYGDVPVELATPDVLIERILEADKVLVY